MLILVGTSLQYSKLKELEELNGELDQNTTLTVPLSTPGMIITPLNFHSKFSPDYNKLCVTGHTPFHYRFLKVIVPITQRYHISVCYCLNPCKQTVPTHSEHNHVPPTIPQNNVPCHQPHTKHGIWQYTLWVVTTNHPPYMVDNACYNEGASKVNNIPRPRVDIPRPPRLNDGMFLAKTSTCTRATYITKQPPPSNPGW